MDHSEHSVTMVDGEHSSKEIIRFVLVILGILGLSSVLAAFFDPGTLEGWTRWFMGIFFITFASFKLLGYKMFVEMFAGYDVVAKRLKGYGYIYPFLELGLGLAYVANIFPLTRDLITLAVTAVGSIGVVQEIRRRSGIHCACLGNFIKLPLSTVSLVEDVGMGLMALAMIVLSLRT